LRVGFAAADASDIGRGLVCGTEATIPASISARMACGRVKFFDAAPRRAYSGTLEITYEPSSEERDIACQESNWQNSILLRVSSGPEKARACVRVP
jgi:hypothetical protein